ncbi:MAG TPA: c-type cytochrome [Dissulfurispiraceae bacterium]|nr:c-type cytochrome [Dissulfurispiraceae bacterium]
MLKKTSLAGIGLLSVVTISAFAAAQQEAPAKNPFAGDAKSVSEGSDIFKKNCESCHGAGGKGDICPPLTTKNKKYGNTDGDLFLTISKGRPGGMPSWNATLSAERIWKVITYIRSIEK